MTVCAFGGLVEHHNSFLFSTPDILRVAAGLLEITHSSQDREKQPLTLSHTPTDNLEFPKHPACMFTDCGRKPENPRWRVENMQTLHTKAPRQGIEPATFLLELPYEVPFRKVFSFETMLHCDLLLRSCFYIKLWPGGQLSLNHRVQSNY